MEQYLVRPVVAQDWAAVLRLLEQLWPGKTIDSHTTLGVLKEQLDQPDKYLALVADAGREVVGFVSLSWRLNLYAGGLIARVDELVVDRERRSQGIGKLLMERAVAFCRKRGIRVLYLSSGLQRKDAHAFYLQAGFQNVSYTFEMHFP